MLAKRIGSVLAIAVLLLTLDGSAWAQVARTNYFHITTDSTFLVKPGAGILTTVCLNAALATEVITIFDSLTAAGTVIAAITVPTSPQPVCLPYNVNFQVGLTVLTATATGDITVGYQ
jgi:hypothetical protein